MINPKSVKLLASVLVFNLLSACVDLSMYDQSQAPVGQVGEAAYSNAKVEPISKTNPISKPIVQAIEVLPAINSAKPPVHNNAVLALLDSASEQKKTGSLSRSASTLERAVRIAPANATVWHQLAVVRFEQNNFQLAESLARKSNLLASNNRWLRHRNWLLIANIKLALGDRAAAKLATTEANRLR